MGDRAVALALHDTRPQKLISSPSAPSARPRAAMVGRACPYGLMAGGERDVHRAVAVSEMRPSGPNDLGVYSIGVPRARAPAWRLARLREGEHVPSAR